MADGSESSRRQDNSRVTSALITGAFGLMGTVVTIFAMRQNAPTAASQVDASLAPPSAVTPQMMPPRQPVAGEPLSNAASAKPAPNLLLNFAEFQARLAKTGLSQQQRDRIVRPLLGHTVVWKGYVDSVTGMTAPKADRAITVTLVESRDKLSRSMFKTPAHFRFAPEALEAVAGLAAGDLVTLSGTLEDHSLIATNVTDAHVHTVNDRLATRAADPDRTARH